MFKELLRKLFVESLVAEEEPLDFGAPVADTVIDDQPQAKKKKPISTIDFLGQPVRSKIIADQLKGYIGNIRKMLVPQYMSNLQGKEAKKGMRDFLRNTVYNKRAKTVSPNVNQELFNGNKPEKFEAFLQEWLYDSYLKLLDSRAKEPSIEWSKQHIDLKDHNYIKAVLSDKFWDNVKGKLFQMPEVGDLYNQFKVLDDKETARRAKSRQRAADRRAGVAEVDQQIVDEINQKVMNRFKKQYGDEEGERIYYATANKQGRNPENFHQSKK